MAYRPYSRSLECLTICRCHSKGAHSLQLFQDPECWSRLDLEPSTSPTADALQHELTRRRFFYQSLRGLHLILAVVGMNSPLLYMVYSIEVTETILRISEK